MRKKKKQKSLRVVLTLICLMILIYFIFPVPNCSLNDFDKRAVWVSYQDLSKLSFENQKLFEKDFKEIVSNAQKQRCNTVIVHIRAFSDALYLSQLFPISSVITHQTQLSFDPLESMIDLTHQEGLAFEAWINPYRISINEKTYQQFIEHSMKRKWLNDERYTIHYGTYQYILNPAHQEVRDYITKGVQEIVKNYDVDGIHFDDYFYVEGAYRKTTQEERLNHVNALISQVYSAIKNIKEDVSFGISPQGNYENCLIQGADVNTWLKKEGYVDYVMPQIYWSDSYGLDGNTKMFTKRAKTFSRLKKHKNIKLYAGLAIYRTGQKDDRDLGWSQRSDNLSNQIQTLYKYGYDGYSLFDYSSMMREEGQKEMSEVFRYHPD